MSDDIKIHNGYRIGFGRLFEMLVMIVAVVIAWATLQANFNSLHRQVQQLRADFKIVKENSILSREERAAFRERMKAIERSLNIPDERRH